MNSNDIIKRLKLKDQNKINDLNFILEYFLEKEDDFDKFIGYVLTLEGLLTLKGFCNLIKKNYEKTWLECCKAYKVRKYMNNLMKNDND